MGSPADLSLDCKPHGYSTPVKPFGDQTEQTQKLEDFIACLEEESLKIDAFKRELPLCMQLLNKEMEASRQQLQNFRTNQRSRMILEEFIPVKNSSSEGSEKVSEKSSWMTTAQLWSQSNGRGAFLPFSRERKTSASSTPSVLPELALGTNGSEMEDNKCTETDNGASCSFGRSDNSSMVGDGGTMIEQTKGERNSGEAQIMNTTQARRKARRCWSPDLHRRFVNALQMLGGSQVATPKQIRDLMKVDGLTNDEVKSHLQKYRLHTRRPGPSPQAVGAAGTQVVVLGGFWVPPEYATAAAATHTTGPAIYGAHSASHASIHCSTPGMPQDLYPPPHHVQLHHPTHNFHHQHPYKASSQTHSSPESNGRPAGDDSETIEDGKSESSNFNNGDSGESGGERKKERKDLASLRDDGEESNGSEITLKF